MIKKISMPMKKSTRVSIFLIATGFIIGAFINCYMNPIDRNIDLTIFSGLVWMGALVFTSEDQ